MPSIANAARLLVSEAFAVLTAQHVLPTPAHHPFIRVGRDYFGPDLMDRPMFKALEHALDQGYPSRFNEPLKRKHAEFANTYVFSFIEACARRCAASGDYRSAADAVTQSIEELVKVLTIEDRPMAAVRAMTHVTTTTGETVVVDGIEVVPEPHRAAFDFLIGQCRAKIPGAGSAFNRQRPTVFGHPHAVLATSATPDSPDGYETLDALSNRISRFTLLLRLLTGTTARPHFEVRGPATLIAAIHPQLLEFQRGLSIPMVRRAVAVGPEHAQPVRQLGDLLAQADVKRKEMAAASFDMALAKFSESFDRDSLTALLDLATALEAVLLDKEDGTEATTLRLSTRAAALLATDADTPANIFADVKAFYALRSILVHGGNLSERTLRTKILGISTLTETGMFGIAAAQAVDRMRDLVRRASLARLCLAAGESPLWRFDPSRSMDVAFADEQRCQEMRAHWHSTLGDIDAAYAASHLPPPSDIMREDYGPRANDHSDD